MQIAEFFLPAIEKTEQLTKEDGEIQGFHVVYTLLPILRDLKHRKTTFGDDHFAQFFMFFLSVFDFISLASD